MALRVIRKITGSEFAFLQDSSEAKRLCFLTGSAVSTFSPSFLPSGDILRSTFCRSLIDNFPPRSPIRTAMDAEGIKAVPLEQCFQEAESAGCSDIMKALDFLSGSPSDPVLYNPLHTFIAGWQNQFGCPVITTNFDLLHEQAYLATTGQIIKKCIDADNSREVAEIIHNRGKSLDVLLKLHGSIESYSSLIATLWRVGKGLNPWLQNLLEYIRQNHHICIVGYSGSDPDIGPILLKPSPFKIIWVVRPDSTARRGFSKLGVFGEQVIDRCNGFILLADLQRFFSSLAEALLSSTSLSREIHDLTDSSPGPSLELSIKNWANAQTLSYRIATAARIFLAAIDTDHARIVLGSLGPEHLATSRECIQILWLKGQCESLAHRYKTARKLFHYCLVTAGQNNDAIAEISSRREMAHQERMLGHPLRAWLGMKLAESVCKAPSLPPTSSAIGFSPRQLLIETIINRVEIEFSIIRLFPKPLRMALVPARLRQLNEGLFLQKELGIPDIRANLLRRRGLAYHLMSQYRLAEEDLLNAKIMFSSLGRVETGIINVLGGLADLYYGMQDFTKARQCSLEAIGLATGEGGIAGLAKHFRRLARIEMLEGRPDKARLMIVQMKKAGGTIEGAINRIRYAGPFWLISLIIRLSTLKIKRKGRSL